MGVPTILFNSSTGSDTAASGAGPSTAKTGTNASFSGTPSTVTLDGSPDLTGVATDGTHCLWIKTSTGRQFSKITAADNGAKTVTVEDTLAGTSTGRTWGIGGKRATLDHADSRTLVGSSGAKPGWTIQTETDQTVSSQLSCAAAGDTTTGFITLKGDSLSSQRIITTTANAAILEAVDTWRIQNLQFRCSNATRTSSYGILLDAACSYLQVKNCIFGHATNKLQTGIIRTASAQPSLVVIDCEFTTCLGPAIQIGGGASYTTVQDCWVHGCGATAGIYIEFASLGFCVLIGNLITGNTGDGIRFEGGGSNSCWPIIRNNTIDSNTGDGIDISGSANWPNAVIAGNNVTTNSNFGVRGVSASDALKAILDFNNFGTGATANTSGAVSGVSTGASDLTVDPSYTATGSNNYAVGTNVKAKAFPDSTRTLGANQSGTTTYVDIGAAQRQESASGGGASPIGLGSPVIRAA